ncbi:MAG: hypothetical protein MZW92_24735 [Comamonadaceae bacterium]|nr:hypothetical protein [Comamonadaceae bacterium]
MPALRTDRRRPGGVLPPRAAAIASLLALGGCAADRWRRRVRQRRAGRHRRRRLRDRRRCASAAPPKPRCAPRAPSAATRSRCSTAGAGRATRRTASSRCSRRRRRRPTACARCPAGRCGNSSRPRSRQPTAGCAHAWKRSARSTRRGCVCWSTAASGRLRGAPRFDDLGRFVGYAGTAEPVGALDALAADHGALQALMQALPLPTLLAAGDGDPSRWILRGDERRGPRAGSRPKPPAGATCWRGRRPRCARRWPAPAPDAAAEVDGWVLRRFETGAGAGLLLMQAARGEAGDGGDSAAFGFTVTHDLRAPIRVVEGFTRILKEDYGRLLDRIGNEHLDRVLGAAARMNQMIDSMLALAKLSQQPLARQPVNLSQLAGWIVDDLRRGAPGAPCRGRDRARTGDARRPDAAAPGAGEPARQRVEVQRAQRAGADRLRPPAARGPARVLRARQRRGLRHALGRPPVRPVPAPAQRQRVPRQRRRPGRRCGASSRRHGGEIWAESGTRPRRDVLVRAPRVRMRVPSGTRAARAKATRGSGGSGAGRTRSGATTVPLGDRSPQATRGSGAGAAGLGSGSPGRVR